MANFTQGDIDGSIVIRCDIQKTDGAYTHHSIAIACPNACLVEWDEVLTEAADAATVKSAIQTKLLATEHVAAPPSVTIEEDADVAGKLYTDIS